MEKRVYIEDFIIFSPQQYVVVRDKNDPYNYTLQKQNLNYVVKKVTNIKLFKECKNEIEHVIHSLFMYIQGKITSAMYKIPSDKYYNRFYFVWSILYKKDKIDSFYDSLKKEPLMLKKLLDKILSNTCIHHTTFTKYKIKDNVIEKDIPDNLIEIYKLDIEFIADYKFNITFHLYDITTKEFYVRFMEFNYHPDDNYVEGYRDKVVAWHKNNLIKQIKAKEHKKEVKAYIESLKYTEPEKYAYYKRYPRSIG